MKKLCFWCFILQLMLASYCQAEQTYYGYSNCRDDYNLSAYQGVKALGQDELEILENSNIKLTPVTLSYPYKIDIYLNKIFEQGEGFKDVETYHNIGIIFINENEVITTGNDRVNNMFMHCRFIIWQGYIFVNKKNPYYISSLEIVLHRIFADYAPVIFHGQLTQKELDDLWMIMGKKADEAIKSISP